MKIIGYAAAMLLLSSCNMVTGNGHVRKENRNPGDFTGVRSSGSVDVEISNGTACSVTVEDDDNLLPYLVTEVINGTLYIHYKNGTSVNNDHSKVYVTAPALNEVNTSGSADIVITDVLKSTDKIDMSATGSGSIKGAVDAPAISVDISGSGNVKLSGRTKDFDCSVTGSGDADCGSLASENTKIDVSGSGNAHVFASVHLSASVTGSGDVYYRGNPPNPDIHTSGSGSVHAEQ
ncbi:MAG TPA: head GIN domain-containing protein [Chitinophagaceae bacterium]|nr:head GIN domain-containing protein [Chitinophagaceae bacterium]